MRIATWNVNSLNARLPRVEEWLAQARPDILCMQETKLSDDAFPAMTFAGLRYDDEGLYSWWDYQAGAFHKHWGMRIDLLLASDPLAARLSWVIVDRNGRK